MSTSLKRAVKSRRDTFEQQLKSLQEDVSILSQNLATHRNKSIKGKLNGILDASNSNSTLADNSKSLISNTSPMSTRQSKDISDLLRKEVVQLKQELLTVSRQRDDLMFREELVRALCNEIYLFMLFDFFVSYKKN